jgi:hypothetical protein
MFWARFFIPELNKPISMHVFAMKLTLAFIYFLANNLESLARAPTLSMWLEHG